MTSLINRKRGFTFVEIMVTLAVLSFGLVVIYQSFLICVNALSYYSTSLEVREWLDGKTWEIDDKISRTKTPLPSSNSGTFIVRNKPVFWQGDIQSISRDANEYRITLSCFWKEGRRQINLSRTFYAGA
ncbi:MAG: prepilin-type N-terminal cleavage/methylation domain-containing protein [Candidatus Omnitrophota bacterium]